MTKEYAVVTAISTFRHRYVVPMDKLQELNTNYQVDPKWAADAVVMQEVKEFSQEHLGEQICDLFVMNEEEILELFDRDNSYASSWSKEYKLKWLDYWKDSPSAEEAEEFEKIRQENFKVNQERYHDYITRRYEETREDTYDT